MLIDRDPHALLEGILISGYAIKAKCAYIYIRGEFVTGAKILQKAVDEAEAAGLFKGFPITVHRGAGAYICGEETGLLSSLEGNRGYPKIKPPFPAVEGLFRCPTIVNNVETLMTVTHIIKNGADWFRKMGTEKSPGMKIFSVCGHVNRPGNYEIPLSVPLKEVIYDLAGGIRGGKKLKAVIPGGLSAPMLTAAEVLADPPLKMDFDALAAAKTMLGSGGVIVIDDETCIVDVLWNTLRFYHHESCGQCTPCREGTGWIEKLAAKMEQGRGRADEVPKIDEVAWGMVGRTICVPRRRRGDARALDGHEVQGRVRSSHAGEEVPVEARQRAGAVPMPNIKLNGKDIEVDGKDKLLKICLEKGAFVPHYCWHPGLTPRRQLPHVPRSRSRTRRSSKCRACTRSPTRWRSRPRGPRSTPAARRSSSTCSSTTRSTARSATRPASATCRTTPTSTGRASRGSRKTSRSSTRRISGRTSDLGQPVHRLHPLRPVLRGGHGHRRALRHRARRPQRRRRLPGHPDRQPAVAQRRRPLPGRRAHRQELHVPGPRLVHEADGVDLRLVQPRVQRRRDGPRQRDQAAPAAAERRGEPVLDVRRGPPQHRGTSRATGAS
jgi:NADH:ubiquinone oxidoreductase subunit F (NADH-binding)